MIAVGVMMFIVVRGGYVYCMISICDLGNSLVIYITMTTSIAQSLLRIISILLNRNAIEKFKFIKYHKNYNDIIANL